MAPSSDLSAWKLTLFFVGLGAVVLTALIAGLAFGAYELRRLGQKGDRREATVNSGNQLRPGVGKLVTH